MYMKKKIIINLFLILILIIVLFLNINRNKSTFSYALNNGNDISVMVYDINDGEFVNNNAIPVGDYSLNEELSYCQGNSQIISYNSTLGTVTTKFNSSDKCYFYFDLNAGLITYFENNKPAGYRGEDHIDSPTGNLYRFTGEFTEDEEDYEGVVDNYICLDPDTGTCPEDSLYRIIGVVAADDSTTGLQKGMVKVIRNAQSKNPYRYDGGASWGQYGVINSNNINDWTCDESTTDPTSGCFPTWAQSTLNTINLNRTFLNSVSSFSDNIASVKWHCYVGSNTPTVAAENAAPLCSNTPTKISLMYASDYVNAYDNGTTLDGVSWLQPCVYTSNIIYLEAYLCAGFTVTSSGFEVGNMGKLAVNDYTTYRLSYRGGLTNDSYLRNIVDEGEVYQFRHYYQPVFFLNSDVTIESGDGTYSDPYRISSELYDEVSTPTIYSQAYSTGTKTSSQDGSTYKVTMEANDPRYEGKDPDNYVCFKENCTPDELYRIISGRMRIYVDNDNDGEADGNKIVMKLVKYTPLEENMAWDSNGTIDWANSSLNDYLNNDWDPPYDNIYTARWYYGGHTTPGATTATFETKETTGSYSDGKIGLMYVYDYGYASISTNCDRSTYVGNYSNTGCYDENWLFDSENEQWTLSPRNNSTNRIFTINTTGKVRYTITSTTRKAVKPAFYIPVSTVYISGDGSLANPYIVLD